MKVLNKKTLFIIFYFFILSDFASGAFKGTPFKGTPSKRSSPSSHGGDRARARTDDDHRDRLNKHSPNFNGALGNTAARVAQRKALYSESSLFRTRYQEFTKVGQDLLSVQTENVKKAKVCLAIQTKQRTLRKKSIISAAFAILNKDGTLVSRYDLPHLYWSSKNPYGWTRKNPDGKEISTGQRIKGLVVGVCKQGQSPMQHHHSERAFFTHIHKNFEGLLEEAQFSITKFDSKKHVFAILMGNSYSSCTHCAGFLGGSGESSTQVADIISADLKRIFNSTASVDVLIFHQGVKSYSKHLKKGTDKENHVNLVQDGSPVMEMRPSSSLSEGNISRALFQQRI